MIVSHLLFVNTYYHVNPLNGNRRVDNDTLASLIVMTNDHLPPLVLIGDQGRDVGLDPTSSDTDDKDSRDETAEASAMIESGWNGGACEDEQTEDVDEAEDDDGVVLSEVLVGDYGTENGCDFRAMLVQLSHSK